MKVELSWESTKKSIQDYLEKKVVNLGENCNLDILDSDNNVVEKVDCSENFRYISDSKSWLLFIGLAVAMGVIFSAAAGVFPIELVYKSHWYSDAVYNWQNIGIFVIGLPILTGTVFGYIGSKIPTYTIVDLRSITRWNLCQDGENVLSVFYNDADSINVKSFDEKADHLAAEIASDLSKIIGEDSLSLTVCGKVLLSRNGKKLCQYCGLANNESESKCEKCGANLS